MDKSCLESLLRSHYKNCLHSTSANTAQEIVSSSFFSKNVLLNVSVRSKSDVVLGDREHEKGAVTLIHTKETTSSICVLEHVDGAHSIL